MSWFKKKTSPTDLLPPDRIAALPIMVGFGAQNLAHASNFAGAILATRFFAGYLLGYPIVFDELDERLGGAIRKMLFDSILGSDDGPSFFRNALAHLSDGDQQTRRGRDAGVLDGKRFFQAIQEKRNADDATDALKVAFDLKLIDPSQNVLVVR